MIFRHLLNMRSHPTWVRGLKHVLCGIYPIQDMSHPTWVRGLKPALSDVESGLVKSHPTWVRGLKQHKTLTLSIHLSRTLRGCVD